MSRIIKCENGHFYDADKFASCPHCNVTKQETKKEKNDSKVEDLDTMVTVAKYLFGGSKRFRKTPDVSGSIVKPPKEHLENEITPEMRQVQQMALGRQKKDDDQLTVRFQLPESGLEPVVGWLVCVTGKSRGKDYRLKAGFNRIGRNPDMDILLKGVSSQQLELLLPKEQFLYQVKDTQEGVRIILIGMNTSGIGLGKHEIIKIKGGNATIGHAMLVNKEAKEVPSDYEGKIHQDPTGNEKLSTEVADPTHIRIDSDVQAIRFSVYDLLGRVLTTSRIDKPVPGEYSIYAWIPQRLPSGVYLLRIEMQKEKETLYQTIKFSQIK